MADAAGEASREIPAVTSRRIIFHRDAAAEAEAAAGWYEERGKGLGADFVGELERVSALVVESPRMWPRSTADARARFAPFARFPYALVFVVLAGDEVVVIAVAHGRRRPSYWLRQVAPGDPSDDVR
jgi:plasmid stabilization system protein ParE